MIQRLKFAFLTLLVGGAAWLAPTAKADGWDKLTILTFNNPVEIPGQVLPAGTYVFKLLDSSSDRNIVQIFTEDQQHLVTTVMAIPAYREERTGKTVVTFEERPSGSAEAMHKWFYPGDNYGFEFVYPKSEQQYADRSEPPAPPAPVAPAPPPAPTVAAAPEQPNTETPEPVAVREEEEVVIAQATPVEPADNNTGIPDTLPQTAGNFTSLPLLGLVLLSGGFTALRFATKQS